MLPFTGSRLGPRELVCDRFECVYPGVRPLTALTRPRARRRKQIRPCGLGKLQYTFVELRFFRVRCTARPSRDWSLQSPTANRQRTPRPLAPAEGDPRFRTM